MQDIIINGILPFANLKTVDELSKLNKNYNQKIEKKMVLNDIDKKFLNLFDKIKFDINKIKDCKIIDNPKLKIKRFREILDNILNERETFKDCDTNDCDWLCDNPRCGCAIYVNYVDYNYSSVRKIIDLIMKKEYQMIKIYPKIQKLFDDLNEFEIEFGGPYNYENEDYENGYYNEFDSPEKYYQNLFMITIDDPDCDVGYEYVKRIISLMLNYLR